jgi:NADH-quinone oxidoreductase subunit M
VALLLIPFVGGVAAWVAARWSVTACRWLALASALAGLGLAIGVWAADFHGWGLISGLGASAAGGFVREFNVPWIPQAGIRFHLGVDGLSLIMLMLTFAMVALAVLVCSISNCCWPPPRSRASSWPWTSFCSTSSSNSCSSRSSS